jgi:hypothetical protein
VWYNIYNKEREGNKMNTKFFMEVWEELSNERFCYVDDVFEDSAGHGIQIRFNQNPDCPNPLTLIIYEDGTVILEKLHRFELEDYPEDVLNCVFTNDPEVEKSCLEDYKIMTGK